jgi:hypothetical protein
MTHKCVTFRSSVPVDLDKHPPGEELAQYISLKLTAAGLKIRSVDNYEDFAWWIECDSDKRMPWVLLGYIGDDPEQWLITINSNVGWLGRLLGRSDLAGRQEFNKLLHSVLSNDPAFSDIRWHLDDWGQPGWSNSPDEPDADYSQ